MASATFTDDQASVASSSSNLSVSPCATAGGNSASNGSRVSEATAFAPFQTTKAARKAVHAAQKDFILVNSQKTHR